MRVSRIFLLGTLLSASFSAQAYDQLFDAGALIIPQQSDYQSACGSVSAYGLVYRLLQHRITISWIIAPGKTSHDRCVNDDETPIWNDGCDFVIRNALGPPVSRLVNNSATFDQFAMGPKPYYTPSPPGSGPSVIKYMGGPFVVDANDASSAIALIKSHPDFAPYRTPCSCGGLPIAQGGCHYVTVHRAEAQFIAPVARVMNEVPPRIALLGAGAVTILQKYLANAALDFPGAGGTFTSHGAIYDVLQPNVDLISTPAYPQGKLNARDPADPKGKTYMYRILWAPHWEGKVGENVADGSPGDAVVGDGRWTDSAGRNDLENALANIALFTERKGGLFAECASIETFEGSWKSTQSCTPSPSGCEGPSGVTTPLSCPTGYSLGSDNSCYACTSGTFHPATNQCQDACPPGSTESGGTCTGCPSGYSFNASMTICLSNCPAGSAALSDTQCGSCPAGYTLDAAVDRCVTAPFCTSTGYKLDFAKDKCTRNGKPDLPIECPASTTYSPSRDRCEKAPSYTARSSNSPVTVPRGPTPPSASASPQCGPGQTMLYTDICTTTGTPTLDIPGYSATQFHVTNRLDKNGLNSFTGPDCTSPGYAAGDCFQYRDEGNPLAQRGDFSFARTGGHINNYKPSLVPTPASAYREGVVRFISSYNNVDPQRRNWDFFTFRFKDNNPRKGPIVYLAGHDYSSSVTGSRLVLNTLLNLQFLLTQTELSRSEPVAELALTSDGSTHFTLYSGTYLQAPPPGPFSWWQTFSTSKMEEWIFPYIEGRFRQYESKDMKLNDKSDFGEGETWEASERLPSPGQRTIYTWLEGPAPGRYLNGKLGVAWRRVNFDFRQVFAGCLLAPGLSKVCELTRQIGLVSDFAAIDADPSQLDRINDATAHLIQKVRGFCIAHQGAIDPVKSCHSFTPGTSDDPGRYGNCSGDPMDYCDNEQDDNRASLGGIDHSTAAVIGPSRYIRSPRPRPTVAYVGARDGMLHAFYISGGTGYTGMAGELPPWTPPQPGTELWAVIPPGQLSRLKTNDAMVDGSPVVLDVFADFEIDANGDGDLLDPEDMRKDGRREWRTVLISTVGRGGGEMIALDITNPLRPALLWHLSSSRDSSHVAINISDPAGFAWKFSDDPATSVNYDYPIVANRTGAVPEQTGPYAYADLGMTVNISVGLVRRDNLTRFQAFLATNAGRSGHKALEVFGIDAATGAKLWQFERPYPSDIADNTVIPGASLLDLDGDGFVDRVYVGSMDGTLWELDAFSGRNLNYLPTQSGSYRSFPLYATNTLNQPISTVPSILRLPNNLPSSTHPARGHIALAFGTGGTDWALANDPALRGRLVLVPVFPAHDTRYSVPIRSSDENQARLTGVVRPETTLVNELAPKERIYGSIRVVGNQLLVATSLGSLEGNLMGSRLEAGSTWLFGLSGSAPASITSAGKSAVGVLVMGDNVITQTVSGIDVRKTPSVAPLATSALILGRGLPVRIDAWFELERRRAW